MCGISLYISKKNNPSGLLRRFVEMNNAIKHRGPDDEGYLIVDAKDNIFPLLGPDSNREMYINRANQKNIDDFNTIEDIKLILGFRRLAILDLSANGHQPMGYLNKYYIIFNGEIYNYLSLRSDLELKGYCFNSNTDTEVIMALYDCYGVNCFNMMNGMWALVIYDMKTGNLVISRDRFSVKPLYYYQDNDTLLFASEIKQFIAFGGLNIQPNYLHLKNEFQFLTKEYTKDTPFSNVSRFPAASYSIINLNNNQTIESSFKKYYHIPYAEDSQLEQAYSEKEELRYCEEYLSLLDDAVKIRLQADVNIGTALSGGLDSTSIAYFINKNLKNSNIKQKTFSIVFPSPETKK